MHPILTRILSFACVLFLGAAACRGANDRPMNVLFILADDLGWSDTTLYGGTRLYETPHIQRLARRGLTFTRAYTTSPLCSPTRASILTGQSPARHGITTPACHLPQVELVPSPTPRGNPPVMATTPQTATRLRTDHVTLAETLQAAGYATGHFGKWHLGHPPYSPLEHGFDVDIPHWGGPGPAGSYVAPWKFPDFDPDTPHQHIEDRMAQEAVRFMEQHRDQPFFLNYWMFSVHAPFDAKPALIEKYRSKVRPEAAQRSPTYAAMIESMDDAVGVLLDALDRLGLADQTIVIFTSDNGGNMYNQVDGATPTSNRPLRGGKATMFDGGVRVPLVIHWPGVTEPGGRTDALASSCDFYPTLLEMLPAPAPAQQVFDGSSLVPVLRGKAWEREAIFCYFPHSPPVPDWIPPSACVIQGDWKLVRIFHGARDKASDRTDHRYLLFDLANDIGESRNLAASHPDRVQQLDQLLERHLRQTDAVRPLPNPDFDPAKYDPQREGKPRGRPSARQGARRGPAGKPAVAGWRPNQHCSARVAAGELRITSTGGDPYLVRQLSQPLPAGAYRVELQYKAECRGQGQWFWQEQGVRPGFSRNRSQRFALEHDGALHTVNLRFTSANPILSLRLDPGQGPGTVTVTQLKVTAEGGGRAYHLSIE